MREQNPPAASANLFRSTFRPGHVVLPPAGKMSTAAYFPFASSIILKQAYYTSDLEALRKVAWLLSLQIGGFKP